MTSDVNITSSVAIYPLCLLAILLGGCQSTPKADDRSLKAQWRPGSFIADQENVLSASAGANIFVSGDVFDVPAIRVGEPFSFAGPGGVQIDFPISTVPMIEETGSQLLYIHDSPISYTTRRGKVKPLVIGFAESKSNPEEVRVYWKQPEDSFFYGQRSDEVPLINSTTLQRTRTNFVNPSGRWITLYYAGYYNDQIHFELEDSSDRSSASRLNFHFDIKRELLPMQAAIRGLVFEVSTVDAVSLKYRWVKISF